MSEQDENNIIEISSFTRFINKLSKINSENKLLSLMNEFNISNDCRINFPDMRSTFTFEHCTLLSSNSFVLRYLVETGSKSFNQFINAAVGYSGIFDQERREQQKLDPDNYLINNYNEKSFGTYSAKPISLNFIETVIELFPDTLNYDKFLKIIIGNYLQKEIPIEIKDNFPRLFGDRITKEGVDNLIHYIGRAYQKTYLGLNSNYIIEKNVDLYSLKNEKNLSYILSSPYQLGMINKLFDINSFKSVFEAVYTHMGKNAYQNKNAETGYTLGTLSHESCLHIYSINNDDYEKVKFYVKQFEKSQVKAIENEYNYILSQTLSATHYCDKIIDLFANEFSYKSYNHFDNINHYFIGDYKRENKNLTHYLNAFNLNNMVLDEQELHSLISNIFKSKKIELFNDFIESSLFKNEQLDIILEELGNSLSRKKGATVVKEKETAFYSNIIDLLQRNDLKTTEAISKYLSKNNEPSVFRSLLEYKLLNENLEQQATSISSIKRRRM
ncbi:TPA: hypothetical protein NV714_002642 [Escherichia coli]|nr:hypothetical protein [Escherichia coli]